MAPTLGEARKDLSADSLFRLLRSGFDSLSDPRPRSGEVEIPLADALMSAFAMFSLKDPSLLAFDQRRRDPNDNFRTIYGINRRPLRLPDAGHPRSRSIPTSLRPGFREIFRRLQRGKVLERFVYLDGHYLVSLDGTAYFSSTKIHCPSCLEKHHRNGSITYSHQLLGATLVHPDLKEVIPLAPEPIIQQDGQTKNDCERNATRRWLKQFRQEHPHLPVIVVEDALSANAPHLKDLRRGPRALHHRRQAGRPYVSVRAPAGPRRGRPDAGPHPGRSGDGRPASFSVLQWRAAQRVEPRRVGERAGILGDPSRPDGAAFQLDHRLPPDSGRTFGTSCGADEPAGRSRTRPSTP